MDKQILSYLSDKRNVLEALGVKGQTWLDIDFLDLLDTNIELAEYVLDNFNDTKDKFKIAVKQLSKDLELTPPITNVRFCNLSKTIRIEIGQLRAQHENQLVAVEGFVRRKTKVVQVPESAVFECPSCQNLINSNFPDHIFKAPTKCSCGRKGKFKIVEFIKIDLQRVVLEEDPNLALVAQQPQAIVIELQEDLCRQSISDILQPSKKAIVTGIVRTYETKKDVWNLYIETNTIDIETETQRIIYADSDIKKFKEIANSLTLTEDMGQSIVPNIRGHVLVKEAVFLQLVGSEPLYDLNRLEERGRIHIALIGSPGTGKTKILQRAIRFLPNAKFTGGKTASGVGLVAAVVRDEELGGWSVSAGVVPIASGSLCAIDECDKMSQEDIGYMNNAMVDMRVNIDKAGMHVMLETNTSILAAANPKNRVFDRNEPVWKQIGLPKDFLDRFDLIFPIESGKEEAEVRKVAGLVVGKYMARSEAIKPIYDPDFVTKYIAYAQTVHPIVTDEVRDYIIDNFVNLVKPSDANEDSAYFSYRLLTNIIRLTLAYAKARLSVKANSEDARKAINLLIDSLKKQQVITQDGLMDYEKAEAIVPKSKRDHMRKLKDIVLDLQDAAESGGLADYDQIIELAAKESINENLAEELLEKLRMGGDIIHVRRGKYKLV